MDNVYQAPKTDIQATGESVVERLKGYDTKSLNKLYYRSCNVSAIAGLMVLGVVIISGLAVAGMAGKDIHFEWWLYLILAFEAVAAVGVIMRMGWGRIVGMIACGLMLINIPIGTIIGIVGLVAFSAGGVLFGPGRITHAELKREFKARKGK